MLIHEFDVQHIVIRNYRQNFGAGNWVAVFYEFWICGVARHGVLEGYRLRMRARTAKKRCENLGFGAGEVGAENNIPAEVRCGEREPIGFLARLHCWHIVRQH